MNAKVEWLGQDEGGDVGRVDGDGMVGSTITNRVILVAYKGSKILKQWGIDRTQPLSGASDLSTLHSVAKDYWPGVKKLGADRLCVIFADPQYAFGEGWQCYNGYSFTKGLTPPVAGQQINCPVGQYWDNVQKKCVNAQGVAAYGGGVAFTMPKPLISRGEMPYQGPLTQTTLNTSFLRPQLVAGVGQVEWLGDSGMLGARPPVVKTWFPEITDEEWDQAASGQYAGANTAEILAKANAANSIWYATISQYKSEGACDATKPGRLAGALRAYLIASGGDENNMGDEDDTFGTLECKEWMKVFNKQPDLAAAKSAIKSGFGQVNTGTPTYGWRTVYLSDICGSSVKLPVCQPPQVQPPPPECSPTKPCPAGQICVDGKCVAQGGGGGGSGGGGGGGGVGTLGIVLLVGAALGAIYLAVGGVGKSTPARQAA